MTLIIASLLFAAPLQAPVPLQAGDTWASERSYRYVNEEEEVDYADIERATWTIGEVDRDGVTVQLVRALIGTRFGEDLVKPPKDSVAENRKVRIGRDGFPADEVDLQNPIRLRVDRMMWAAMEPRQGLSWNRSFKAAAPLLSAKVTIKPLPEARRYSVVYSEGDVRGEGVVVLDPERNIPIEMSLTLRDVVLPGGTTKVKVAMRQTLAAPLAKRG